MKVAKPDFSQEEYIKQFIEDVFEMASDFLQDNEELAPNLFIFQDEKINIVRFEEFDEQIKDESLFKIGANFTNVLAVAILTDSYYNDNYNIKELKEQKKINLMDNPDTKEAIMIALKIKGDDRRKARNIVAIRKYDKEINLEKYSYNFQDIEYLTDHTEIGVLMPFIVGTIVREKIETLTPDKFTDDLLEHGMASDNFSKFQEVINSDAFRKFTEAKVNKIYKEAQDNKYDEAWELMRGKI